MIRRIRIEASKARTPPSLLGIERRMAYANRKYHSGLMCGGVFKGLAGEKLSGSPRESGEKRVRIRSVKRRNINPKVSLMV